MEMYEIIAGDLHVWWREMKGLTVVMFRKVEMNGMEIDVEGGDRRWRILNW